MIDFQAALKEFDVMPFFGTMQPHARAKIAEFLCKLIGTADLPFQGRILTPEARLKWLTDVIVEDLGKWPDNGLAEVRAIYDMHFPPADGKRNTTQYDSMESVRLPAPLLPVAELSEAPDPELKALIAAKAEKMRGGKWTVEGIGE